MLEKHVCKGCVVYVSGTLQTRHWRKDGDDSDRFSTEVLLAPGGRVQFLERPNGTNGSNGAEASQAEARESGQPATEATADADVSTSDILRAPWGPVPAFFLGGGWPLHLHAGQGPPTALPTHRAPLPGRCGFGGGDSRCARERPIPPPYPTVHGRPQP